PAAVDLARPGYLDRGQRNQLVRPLEIVVLKRRLVDLASEERLVGGIGLHGIEMLRALDEAGIEDVRLALRSRIRIVPDVAAAALQKEQEYQKDAHAGQYNARHGAARRQEA